MKPLPEEPNRPLVWEYRLVPMGNPLEPGIEERANALGQQGWELAAVDAGVWVFKRPRPEDAPAGGSLAALVEQTVPVVEAPPSAREASPHPGSP